jgi:2-polyprenyl-6-methoxyphenol hydroxylase-like FAD-dependent oxidoreductase
MHADIAILGAGPAGCAAALTLRRYLPELAIALVSEAEPTGSAVGEALSPGALPLMQYLGIQPDFHAVPNVKAGGTACAVKPATGTLQVRLSRRPHSSMQPAAQRYWHGTAGRRAFAKIIS